ncbi:MAG: hypothetical protein LBK55_03150 [Azoarcus sp.]|jgi:HTH-type transcriptional regulator/antitoxin HigA|nr:hypothetical protein [Azoarcus sp.]
MDESPALFHYGSGESGNMSCIERSSIAIERRKRSEHAEFFFDMNIKPIHTEDDYNAAMARVDDLWEAVPGSPESDELEVLAVLIGSYESSQTPLSLPKADLLEAITHLMEQRGL